MKQTALKKKMKHANPYVLVILSFLIVIVIGSILLTTPMTNVWGKWLWNTTITYEDGSMQTLTYLDCLLTAVSATCVTGVSTYAIGVAESLTFYGQLVVIILIQIGGLGFITFLTFIITLFNSKLQFKDRYFISQMVNSTNIADVVKFVRKLIIMTAIIEGAGVLLGLPVFLTMYPDDIGRAIWNCIFHSISSFNNAGFDLFSGTTSLIGGLQGAGMDEVVTDWRYYYFCSYVMILIILGGISFVVINEIVLGKKKCRQWRAFTKIVLLTNTILVVGGFLCIFAADGFNGALGSNPGISAFNALFQSITCRTAGFMTIFQDSLSLPSKVASCFLMFVGGSPLSTAGGVKTTTLFMLALTIITHFKGGKIHAFNRSYSSNMVIKAMSLIFLGFIVILTGYICISIFESKENFANAGLINTSQHESYIYEVFSCFGTTGFFIGIEPYLSIGSKITMCILMFLGRLGPMTFFQIFQENMSKEINMHYDYVEEDFLIG